MTDDTLVMNGKTYISSAGAADLVGYTKDYVGQLARAGKLDAKLIGRSWYISKDSLLEHKGSVNYTLTKPKKARKKVSHVTKKANEDIAKSPISDTATDSAEPISTQMVEEEKDESQDVVDLSFTTNERDIPVSKKGAPTKSSRVLVDADIEFETAEPLFYEDNRPVMPEPKRAERFDAVPVTKPRSSAAIEPQRLPRAVRRLERRSTSAGPVSVDGVRLQKSAPSRKMRQSVPDERMAQVSKSQSRVHRKSEKRSSKAVPVLGSIAVFVVFVVWYLVSR